MDTIGIRELKAHLSHHLKRVRAGRHLLVTERGRTIATISPVGAASEPPEFAWARRMVAEGRLQWAGGKPQGPGRPLGVTSGPSLADTVLEDRR